MRKIAAVLLLLAVAGCARTVSPPEPVAILEFRTVTDMLLPADDRSRPFCATEGMLGSMGDPPLQGRVRTLDIRQSGEPDHPTELPYRYETSIRFAEDGRRMDEKTIYSNGYVSSFLRRDDGFEMRQGESVFRYVTSRDSSGRPCRVDLFEGAVLLRTEARYVYDETQRMVANTNSLGQRCRVWYDSYGYPVREVWDSAGKPESGQFSEYTASYTPDGRPLAVRFKDSADGETSGTTETGWVYAQDGRVVTIERRVMRQGKEPVVNVQHFSYDDAGRLREYSRPGLLVRYLRDAAGHVTELERQLMHDGVPVRERVVFTNDDQGNWVRARLTSPHRGMVIERRVTYY